MAFGQAVRARRTELGLSQEAVAERADLDRTYITSIEAGERNVGIENVVRIAQALELTTSELVQALP